MKIEQMESYRFTSSYNTFKQCVDITKELIDEKKIMILFGCEKNVNFSLSISKEKFQEEYPDIDFKDYQKILFDEIAVIIEQNIVMPDFEEPSLKEYLMNKEIDESNVFEILNEKQNKRKYVYDTLSVENAVLRYNFKNRTLANKLGEINFEINKFVFPNNDELKYAVIEMVSAEKLSMGNIPNFLDNKRREDRTKFVCDKHDIDYIIKQLQEIKEKIS